MKKPLVDMNLSPAWCGALADHRFEAAHWSSIGDPRASDVVLMTWAREHDFVVLTHDLDFTTLLATTSAAGPSVVQVRAQDVTPKHLVALVARVVRAHVAELGQGALVTIDDVSARVRVLPLR
jgi:predicted nuclease of predicted toxin-antitoxin system